MLPDQPWLVLCPHCHSPIWLDEVELAGEVDAWDTPEDEYPESKPYITPELPDYTKVLDSDHATIKERYLRIQCWWAGNDARRETPDTASLTYEEISNLTALIQLLGTQDEEDKLMSAEILREMSDFDGAETVLNTISAQGLESAKDQIYALVKNRDNQVRALTFDQ